MKDKQTKQKEKSILLGQPQFNHVESAKIGEIMLTSEVLSAQQLLELIFLALKQPDIKNYLNVLESKKKGGTYTG